ncbi:unnamed protein product [Rhizoctonia solani]|uniref:Protein kinase domain-containing protein n=1 Tax=Rhizoctonia solani TaxID=456999 RepID=A0A8H2WW43_9AGAM|nr:unnamed protein product [Rhizoctonia solani]
MISHNRASLAGRPEPPLRVATPSLIAHEGHKSAISSVAFSPDGKSVISAAWDTIRTWDAHRPSPIGEPLTGHTDWINSVSYCPFGNIIASGSSDMTVRLWNINVRRQLGTIESNHMFYSVAFSPDAKLIASGCGGYSIPSDPSACSVQLWDVQNMVAAANPFRGHTNAVCSVQFSPDNTRVVSASWDKTIRVWDVERGRTITGPLEGHAGSVSSATFSFDGSQIVSCSYDGTIRLWDARDGRLIGDPYTGHTNLVNSIAFSPHGTYVASGSDDRTVRLWDVRTGRQVDQPFLEHTSDVKSVAFSPCGLYLVSGSNDTKVIIRRVLANSSQRESDSYMSPKSEGDLPQSEATLIVSHMSTQQMFECLVGAGCIDLSPQMDTRQDTAMIVSGGGFGDIWVGRLYNGAKVAIKAWRTDALENCRYKTLKRAARELFYWSRMEHRNIHQLMGVIVFKDQYLGMVSEWMENGHLHNYLKKHPDADRYRLCLDVASGLEYMHSRSTVHGDLKAMNVLVSSDGIARLSDFDFSVMSQAGSLLFTESSNSRSGSIRWVAPEMLAEDVPKRTKQSDIYALGMTMLVNIASGNHCFTR